VEAEAEAEAAGVGDEDEGVGAPPVTGCTFDETCGSDEPDGCCGPCVGERGGVAAPGEWAGAGKAIPLICDPPVRCGRNGFVADGTYDEAVGEEVLEVG